MENEAVKANVEVKEVKNKIKLSLGAAVFCALAVITLTLDAFALILLDALGKLG